MSAAPAANEPQADFPAEVLHAIFAQAWEPSSPDIDLVEKNALRSTVLSCAHVCQHWRLASQDLSCGWPHAIDYRKHQPEVVSHFLNLSRPHLLDVGHRSAPFRIRTKRDIAVLDLLKHEIPRIREWNVEVASIPGQSISSASWILPPHQPAVTALRVWGDFPSSLWDFRRLAGTLCTLSIHRSRFIFPLHASMKFEMLTELSVGSIDKDIALSEMQWLSILRNTTSLELLSIHCPLGQRSDATTILPVQLPHLRFLSMREKLWKRVYDMGTLCGKILQGSPPDCGVELWFPSTAQCGQGGHKYYMNKFAHILRVHWNRQPAAHGAPTPQVELAVQAVSGGFRCSLGTVYNPRASLNWGGEKGGCGVREYLDQYKMAGYRIPPLSVIFDNPLLTDLEPECTTIVAEPLLMHATKVRIQLDAATRQMYSESSDALAQILSCMPAVTQLVLRREDVSLVMSELYAPPSFCSDDVRTAEPTRVLPKLESIVIDVEGNIG